MLLKVLGSILACIVVIFILMWLVTGGAGRAFNFAQSLRNPIQFFGGGTAPGTGLSLPWQMGIEVPEPGMAYYSEEEYGNITAQQQLLALQGEYTDLAAKADEAKTLGSTSPYKSKVTFLLGGSATSESTPASEYIALQVSHMNTVSISLAGWSLQSALSGVRVPLPQAANPFVMGVVNSVTPVTAVAGATIIVATGVSPVGVSFRENVCTGYLAELQKFVPDLDTYSCPDPAEVLPLTQENLQAYGETCVDYVRSIPRCHFPGRDQPLDVTPACKNFAANALSYNGCLNAQRGGAGFETNTWRLYLASGSELWRNTHDIIRLLDAEGRTVDVFTY